jgi:ribosome biogenesis GTPase
MHTAHQVLTPYGWTSARYDDLPARARPARIIRHDGRTLLGITPEGPRTLLLTARLDPTPTVGDWIAVPDPGPGDDPLPILEVLPRGSLLRRQSADGTGDQALAANVDVVLITCGVDRPIRAGRIQRVAAQAWDCGTTPVLVLTKARDDSDVDLPRLELEHPGLQVLATAALEGVGLHAVRGLVAGRTAVLVGESGAGKSTLANALLGTSAARTGAVRAGDAKGRHTTTARQLHLLPGEAGGAIIDTPGIRSFGLATDQQAVDAVFADVLALAAECRFSDCRHRAEPGCAVLGAVEDGRLAPERYAGWARLEREVASAALRASPHEVRAQGKRFEAARRSHKAIRGR